MSMVPPWIPSHSLPYLFTCLFAPLLLAWPSRDKIRAQCKQLLACGADITACVRNFQSGASKNGNPSVFFTTPLAIFLNQVSCWPGGNTETNEGDTNKKYIKTAVENLQFLLDNGAAQAPNPNRVERPSQGPCYEPGYNPMRSAVETLISTMKSPTSPAYSLDSGLHALLLMGSILKGLIRNSIPTDDMVLELFRFFGQYHEFFLPSRIFISELPREHLCGYGPSCEQFKSTSEFFTKQPDHISYLSFWLEVVDSILETAKYQQSLSLFLYCYVLTQGPQLHHAGISTSPQDLTDGKETLFRETITRFLQAGADINFRVPEDCCVPDFMHGSTVLQALCCKYMDRADGVNGSNQLGSQQMTCWKFRPASVNLVCMLVKDFKADPDSQWARDGKHRNLSSIEMLCNIFDSPGPSHYEHVKVKGYVATALAEIDLELVEKWKRGEKRLAERVEQVLVVQEFQRRLFWQEAMGCFFDSGKKWVGTKDEKAQVAGRLLCEIVRQVVEEEVHETTHTYIFQCKEMLSRSKLEQHLETQQEKCKMLIGKRIADLKLHLGLKRIDGALREVPLLVLNAGLYCVTWATKARRSVVPH